MKAIVLDRCGGPGVLALREIDAPEVRPTEVLIRVAACGVCCHDVVVLDLARHGRWVMVGALTGEMAGFNPAQMFTNDISLLSEVSCTRTQLEDALTLVQRGLVRPVVTGALPLAEAAAAHARRETEGIGGRPVLKPD